MKKNRPILKTIGITAGLNLLFLIHLYLFSLLVEKELGQALLFLSVTLILTVGICLFATVPVSCRGILWGCYGVTTGIHLPLSVIMAFTGGNALANHWPGGTGNNLAALLIFLMSQAVWSAGTFAVTVARSRRRGKALREEKRNVKRASKGFTKKWQTLSPARSRLVAILRGSLWVMWLHILTALLFELLMEANLEDTILSYVSFPVLWGLMAALYGLYDRERKVAYTLSAAVSNVLFFLLPTTLLTVSSTPVHKYRFVLHLDSILTDPFDNPEQMLVIGVFLTVWAAMIVFGVGHRKARG